MPQELLSVRIDKWLWAVRVFKTRNQAGEACRGGKVKINNLAVKPSREIKIDDIINIQLGQLTKTIQVTGLIRNRVSAKLATEHVIDLTPEEEYSRLKMTKKANYEKRDKGEGRPTKKQRRQIVNLKRYKL
ncbi:MAG: RNA-binding S4 domain-containing protein [Bacteroidales bacterium]|nr:RNA-binding S4 domain-containing protein [Bacteroidales bacterium]